MAATHPAYNLMKMPGSSGVLTVHGDTGDALRALKFAFKMAEEDVKKTTFLTLCGVYCYTCMPFGLRNVGATFQRLMHITLV